MDDLHTQVLEMAREKSTKATDGYRYYMDGRYHMRMYIQADILERVISEQRIYNAFEYLTDNGDLERVPQTSSHYKTYYRIL